MYRSDKLDELASPPAQPHDDRLRTLVDRLPKNERHVIERVIFGGVTVNRAAEEIGVPEASAKTLYRNGLARLKEKLK
jgi:DNA-directed RNA polymerase specialized sigma24 family protein